MNHVESLLLGDLPLMKETNTCPGHANARHSDTDDILRYKGRRDNGVRGERLNEKPSWRCESSSSSIDRRSRYLENNIPRQREQGRSGRREQYTHIQERPWRSLGLEQRALRVWG